MRRVSAEKDVRVDGAGGAGERAVARGARAEGAGSSGERACGGTRAAEEGVRVDGAGGAGERAATRGARPVGGRGRPGRRRRAGGLWARVFVAVHTLVVLAPLTVVATWAFSSAWPWPGLLPRGFTDRGIDLVLSGSQGAGLGCLALSAGIALASAAISTLAATAAARAVCCHAWRGRTAFRFAVLLPFLVPTTVFAMGVQVAFIRLGLAGTVAGVVLAHAVVSLPYAVAIMCDVTAAAGTRLEDAARTLGAGPLRAFASSTLPQIAPGVVSSMSMCYIVSFSQYFLTLLVGSGQIKTFALVLFPYLAGGDRTVAGAYGLVFVLVTLAVFALFELLLRRLRVGQDSELYAG